MADPKFPFEIGRREGRLTRPIMCRRCAAWTAFDGALFRHADGTEACVQPDAVHQTREATTMTTKTKKKPAPKAKATKPEPLVKDGALTERGKAAHAAVVDALTAPVKEAAIVAPKGLTPAQRAEFDRALAVRSKKLVEGEVTPLPAAPKVTVPKEFAEACELVPTVGMPFASPAERTALLAIVRRATAFAKANGLDPTTIDLISTYNTYINNTESRTAMSTTKKNTTATAKGGAVKAAATGAITEAQIDSFVKAHEASGGKMTKGAIVDAIRASGQKIGYPGGDYLAALLAKRPKAATPAEKPAKATKATPAPKAAAKPAKAATKAPARAEGNGTGKSLKRDKVTPIPKAKDAKKATTAAARKTASKRVVKRVK